MKSTYLMPSHKTTESISEVHVPTTALFIFYTCNIQNKWNLLLLPRIVYSIPICQKWTKSKMS